MTEKSLNLTRRDFMLASAAAVSVPVLTNLSGLVPKAGADEVAKAAIKNDLEPLNPNCRNCQVCAIFFSNCHSLNGHHCWCNSVRFDRSAAKRRKGP